MPQLALTLRSPHGTPWLAFRDPRRIFAADDPADVRACLRDVGRAVRGERCWAAGFVCYEAAAAFGLPVAARPPQNLPLVLFGLFEPGHVTPTDEGPAASACAIGRWEPSISRVEYDAAIRDGSVVVDGTPALAKQLPRWFRWSPFAGLVRARAALVT